MDDPVRPADEAWRPLPQVVARRLQNLITQGEWKPGQKIPSQRLLSEEMDVSRASLREALQMLETLGLIRSEPGRGTFVTFGQDSARRAEARWRYADSFSLTDVFQTRLMLETQIAALAALTVEAAALEALRKATDEMHKGWEAGDLVANVEADLQFHRILADECGNRMLQALYDNVADLLTETQRQPIPRTNAARMAESLGEHRTLIEALRSRDPQAARTAMAAHIRNTALSAGLKIVV